MALVVMRDHFERLLLELKPYLEGCSVAPYVNDRTPFEGDTIDEYDPSTDPGLAPLALLGQWGSPYLNPDDRGEIDANPATWTRVDSGSPIEIYGYVVIDELGFLLYAERDPGAPVTLTDPGEEYSVTLRFTDRNDPGEV